MSAEFHARVEILCRLPICVRLFFLLSGRGSGRGVRFLRRRSNGWLGDRRGWGSGSGRRAGDLLLRNLFANFAFGCKQAAIGNSETFLLLFSHRFSLQCLQVFALDYFGKRQSRDGQPRTAYLKSLTRNREFAPDITQRHVTLATGKGQGSDTRNLADIAAIGLDFCTPRR